MKRLLSGRQVATALDHLCKATISQLPPDPRIAVIGMRTRGQILAERLIRRLRAEKPQLRIDRGVLDITFYRDDLARQRGAPVVRATEIDFDLDDAWVLLVDDVLQTGRSIRAALDALMDLGRPRVVRLAVLVDRGDRELPIVADFIGKRLKAKNTDRIQVKLKETDGEDGVFIIPASAS
jgi:pyrimidine operon attenuation protein/uracil phosphoribosyltransferase